MPKKKYNVVKVKLYKNTDTIVIKRAKFEPGDICNICLEELTYKNPILITTTKCDHVFHRLCLLRWVLENSKTCPTCRGPVGTHPAPVREET